MDVIDIVSKVGQINNINLMLVTEICLLHNDNFVCYFGTEFSRCQKHFDKLARKVF